MRSVVSGGLRELTEAQRKTYRSEYLVDVEGQNESRAVAVVNRRLLVRQVVPSSTWYDDLTAGAGQRFPLPGMRLSETATLYPTESGVGGRASQRFFPAMALKSEEDLDAMDWRAAERYRSAPGCSAWLQAYGRPAQEHQTDPLADEPILRSVTLGDYPQRHKVAFNDSHAERTSVRVRLNFDLIATENLTWPWNPGEIHFHILD